MAILFLCFLFGWNSLLAQSRFERYAVVLEDPPLAEQIVSLKDRRALAVQDQRLKIEAAQLSVRRALEQKKVRIIGATQTLLNAIYVSASPEQAAELKLMPGVVRVQRMWPLKRHMNRAVGLVNAPPAWNTAGGIDNAGAGVKIGILDTGIDQNHAAFQDPSLVPPGGFPKCQPQDCAFTNNKVIVARSYVADIFLGDPIDIAHPDDTSARDRVGHGTAAAMVAAGVRTTSPVGPISGIAPKAFLGNYKIFGSPGVNDITYDDVVIRAMEEAVTDGMDIIVLALGRPAVWGPNDLGPACNLPSSEPCDLRADAVENVVREGLTVVVSAGNDGDLGLEVPALNSIHTPGTAPSPITVGASTNSHIFFSSVQVTGNDVPTVLTKIPVWLGNGPKPRSALTAPLRDVSKLEDNGLACSPLTIGSLAGAIALIERGDCAFSAKVNNAQKAGAVGVVIIQQGGSDFLFPMTGLTETGIPAVLMGSTNGQALKSFLDSHADRPVTLDPTLEPIDAESDTVAYFSSQGPAIGDSAIKPELVAVGTDLYMATQSFDPNGNPDNNMFDPSGWTAAQGTSFSAPMVAGAVALVKQLHPDFTPGQLKSAVVNTATNNLDDFDSSGQRVKARVTAVGAGKLNVAEAVKTSITVEPATLSFGVIDAALPSRGLKITNTGAAPANLRLQVQPQDPRVILSDTDIALQGGESQNITARLASKPDQGGAYEGAVVIEGGETTLRVPFLYLVGDGVPYNAIPLRGFGFVGNVSELAPTALTFKVIDQFGVPVPNLPVQFRATLGNGRVESATAETDRLGIAEADQVRLGPELGEQEFTAQAGGLTLHFPGGARLAPTIRTDGVVNAASGRSGQGLAPGSYISIFGSSLSEATRAATTASLPISLADVTVSFDGPNREPSEPGYLHFVSEGQINVQIPWEFQGLTSAWMKVSVGDSSSALFKVPLNDYSPALFEYTEASTGRLFAAALDESSRLVGTANPARRGTVVQLYANGLGRVDNQPPSGEPTPAEPLARTRVPPTVTIGGKEADVQFSGLAPFNVGLYQINVRVPDDIAAETQPVVVTVGGISSKTSSLPIQ